MRQAEVESQFLKEFSGLYPQLGFRGVRRFTRGAHAPFAFALRVSFGDTSLEQDLVCVVLGDGHPSEVKQLTAQREALMEAMPQGGGVPVIVTTVFGDEAREICRQEGFGCLDLSGNALLQAPHAYMDISGRVNRHAPKKRVRSPFEGKAERVVRRLLLEPARRWSMRELAASAEVSLGLASMVTSSLAEDDVASKSRAGMELDEPGRLLDAWKEFYDLRRSPLHTLRAWAPVSTLLSRLADRDREYANRYALTLWSGANSLFKDEEEERPHLALYWSGALDELCRSLRLQDDVGRVYVFVFEPYDSSVLWGATKTESGLRVAHPVQLFLDLQCGDKQETRLAQRLRTRLLTW